jgi:glycosyltransferase involved in cell wall biosynthesis
MLDMAKMLNQSGIKVSIIINTISKVAFEVPDYIDLYHLSQSDLKKINLTNRHQIKSEQNIKGKNIIRITLSKFPMLVRFKKKLQYLIYLMAYKAKLKINLEALGVDCFISLNMYSFLEITDLFSEIADTVLHIHNDPKEVYTRKNYTPTINLKRVYQNENIKIVCISHEQKKLLSNFLKVDKSRINVIYNSINFERIKIMSKSNVMLEEDYILGLGSLTLRKRFDRLILACIEANKFLVIIGDGPEKENLELLVKKKNAEKLVKFYGFTKNPYPYIKNASALVLTSDSEGLPTVIIEAICLGTTVLSTACKTGPEELLMNEPSQLISLNQSEQEIVHELVYKLNNLPRANSQIITESLERFSFETVYKKWKSVISN